LGIGRKGGGEGGYLRSIRDPARIEKRRKAGQSEKKADREVWVKTPRADGGTGHTSQAGISAQIASQKKKTVWRKLSEQERVKKRG